MIYSEVVDELKHSLEKLYCFECPDDFEGYPFNGQMSLIPDSNGNEQLFIVLTNNDGERCVFCWFINNDQIIHIGTCNETTNQLNKLVPYGKIPKFYPDDQEEGMGTQWTDDDGCLDTVFTICPVLSDCDKIVLLKHIQIGGKIFFTSNQNLVVIRILMMTKQLKKKLKLMQKNWIENIEEL